MKNSSELSLTHEGRVRLIESLKVSLAVLEDSVTANSKTLIIHGIPKIIRTLNAIQIGVLETS
jgi:hypothetical protein